MKSQITNSKSQMVQRCLPLQAFRDPISNFQKRDGITLLLVILVMAALMTISLGIFNIIFTELQVSGEISRSFRALYASDQGLEYMLYRDRVLSNTCPSGPSGFSTPCESYTAALPFGDCATSPDASYVAIDVYKLSGQVKIRSLGRSDCTNSYRTVSRAFQIIY